MITVGRLKEVMNYNPETGDFHWKNGKPAKSAHSRGYLRTCIDRRQYFLHRLAWLYVTGTMPVGQIDHINGNRDDNRWCNLREATQPLNSANMRRRKSNKSGFKGVVFDRRARVWRSYIHVDGKTRYLGTFPSGEEAHVIYQQAAQAVWGEFHRTE